MKSTTGLLSLALPLLAASQRQFSPRPGLFPATGNDTIAGGIFSISLPGLAAYLARHGGMATDVEQPRRKAAPTAGSGPYPARRFQDPALPRHTLYAPQKAPAGVKMPFIAWGNGACQTNGVEYENFLLEVASHGYFVSADGVPGGLGGQSKMADMFGSVDFALKGGADKYGTIDKDKIVTAGHSCGGLEAMSTAYHNPKVKLVMMFNIAIFQDDKRYLLEELKVPVAWFIGGPKDMGYPNAQKDYGRLPKGLPAYKASLNTGHLGTYRGQNGGKFGKAAVAYLEWQLRGDANSKAICLDSKSPKSLVKDNWTVEYKNWS